ncbi:MAG: methylenetetrahydrofolate reductase [NAD(P)H] [Candidatus Omnitrophica bacterium]|nr:methylenetetrahydrofolate reductase [NAD(P)H] [Candidatus Omnitrophota bacterium]
MLPYINPKTTKMYPIKDFISTKKNILSFELFPPKTDKGYLTLLETLDGLVQMKPDFISCTYGAGGGNRDKTFDIVQLIQDQHRTAGLAHLTCVLHTKDEILNILKEADQRGIGNILALRGDPPQDNPDWKPGINNFHFSSELCAFIREHFGNRFSIGVAGFPEGHVLCPDRDQDADYLKIKINNGADFVITQLFFDNQDYIDYIMRLRVRGVTKPVLPGILPITNYKGLVKFTQLCGAAITQEIRDIFEPIADDPQATLEAGITFAVKQCRGLLDAGAPGLHFYTLNKIHPVKEIVKQVYQSF